MPHFELVCDTNKKVFVQAQIDDKSKQSNPDKKKQYHYENENEFFKACLLMQWDITQPAAKLLDLIKERGPLFLTGYYGDQNYKADSMINTGRKMAEQPIFAWNKGSHQQNKVAMMLVVGVVLDKVPTVLLINRADISDKNIATMPCFLMSYERFCEMHIPFPCMKASREKLKVAHTRVGVSYAEAVKGVKDEVDRELADFLTVEPDAIPDDLVMSMLMIPDDKVEQQSEKLPENKEEEASVTSTRSGYTGCSIM